MIELFLKRRIIRQFLNSYSEDQWKELIPEIFEIGVLSLQRSFNKILFTKEELKDILEDLRNSDYYKVGQPKKIEKLITNKHSIDNKNNDIQPYSQTEIDNNNKSRSKQNNLYPSWWHDEQGTALREEIENELKHHKLNKTSNNQIHCFHNNNYHKKMNITKPQKGFEQKICKEPFSTKNDINSIYNNYSYTEIDSSYNKRLVLKKLTKAQNLNYYEPKTRINYKISYDKNLQPELIEEKTKSPRNHYSTGEEKRSYTSVSKEKIPTSKSSRNNSKNEIYSEIKFTSSKGKQSCRSTKYKSRQSNQCQSQFTSQTNSLLNSQENTQRIQSKQQQYITKQQITHPQLSNSQEKDLSHQQVNTQKNQPKIPQSMQNQQMYQEQHKPSQYYVVNKQMNYKKNPKNEINKKRPEEQTQMLQNCEQNSKYNNTNKQVVNKFPNTIVNQQIPIKQTYQNKQIIISNNKLIEKKPHEYNISQNKSPKTSTQDNRNKQQKKIQNQRTSEKLLIEENVQNIEPNIEINENYQQPKTNDEIIQNTHPQQSKQSNFSHTFNSGEQLSMMDLNDDLRSKHKS